MFNLIRAHGYKEEDCTYVCNTFCIFPLGYIFFFYTGYAGILKEKVMLIGKYTSRYVEVRNNHICRNFK